MPAIDYTLSVNGAAQVGAAALGVKIAEVSLMEQASSTLTLQTTGAYDVPNPPINHGDKVELFLNSAKIFEGISRAPARTGSGGGEELSYLVEDAWAQMSRVIYQQTWLYPDPNPANTAPLTILRPQVTLGMTAAGTLQTTGQVMAALVDYAISVGVAIQRAVFDAGVPIWTTERQNITVTEALKLIMRWTPRATLAIDHSTSPPTIHHTLNLLKPPGPLDANGDPLSTRMISGSPYCLKTLRNSRWVHFTVMSGITSAFITN